MTVERATIQPYVDGVPGRFFYQRYDHPSAAAAEEELGALEGGRALVFASGSAATTAVALGLLAPGVAVAVAEGCYFGTTSLLRRFEPWGVEVVEFDQTGEPPAGADLVWLEAPSNPFLSFPDLAAAAAHPGIVVVDATASSPVLLRPLEHGADVVLHSATKYLGGHSDLLAGVLATRDEERYTRLKEVRGATGSIAAPDVAALLLRSLKTLELRVRRQSETALELARRLAAHPAVTTVRYPGLGDPRAARWLDGGFGGLLSFDVADAEAALRVERRVRTILNATSLGGVETTIEARRRWEGERVPEGLLRLSVGIEDVELLWADLEQALG